jgi:hypothetical protein
LPSTRRKQTAPAATIVVGATVLTGWPGGAV